jgi:hypothetical protein
VFRRRDWFRSGALQGGIRELTMRVQLGELLRGEIAKVLR